MKEKYIVTLERPKGVSVTEMKEYIEEAVAQWCHGGCPDDPMFELDGDKIRVKRVINKTKK